MAVSVVIPYHPEVTPRKMLDEALESARMQSVPTEIIAIEDTDIGPAEARNKGIEQASTRYIAFLDADDLWKERKLKKQLEQLSATETGVCIESRDVVPPGKVDTDTLIKNVLLDELTGFTSSLMIDQEHVQTRFDPTLKRYEDHLFLIEATAEAGVCSSPNLIEVRKHEDGLTAQNSFELIHESRKKYHQRLKERVPRSQPYLPIVKRSIWYLPAIVARSNGRYLISLVYLLRSLKYGLDRHNVRELLLLPFYIIRDYVIRS